jgi:hypothetical protein
MDYDDEASRFRRNRHWRVASASGIIVVGVDGSDLTVPYLDDYLSTGATVWQYSGNTIDFGRFDKIERFVDSRSSKVILAKSYSDIRNAGNPHATCDVAGAGNGFSQGQRASPRVNHLLPSDQQ